MILNLPIEVSRQYKNPSQKARVMTEAWAASNLYCPACIASNLRQATNNAEVIDFSCGSCGSLFQLKAKRNALGSKIVDAGYAAMLRAIANDSLPHFLLLTYDFREAMVKDLLLIPDCCLPNSAIEPRKPLASTARRAGWIGCNILLDLVPPDGRIPMIISGKVVPEASVRKQFHDARRLKKVPPPTRGWTLDVLTVLRTVEGPQFSIEEAYSFEAILARRHPENQHVKPKIRQQLQVLRDLGYLEFVKRGMYRWRQHD